MHQCLPLAQSKAQGVLPQLWAALDVGCTARDPDWSSSGDSCALLMQPRWLSTFCLALSYLCDFSYARLDAEAAQQAQEEQQKRDAAEAAAQEAARIEAAKCATCNFEILCARDFDLRFSMCCSHEQNPSTSPLDWLASLLSNSCDQWDCDQLERVLLTWT